MVAPSIFEDREGYKDNHYITLFDNHPKREGYDGLTINSEDGSKERRASMDSDHFESNTQSNSTYEACSKKVMPGAGISKR